MCSNGNANDSWVVFQVQCHFPSPRQSLHKIKSHTKTKVRSVHFMAPQSHLLLQASSSPMSVSPQENGYHSDCHSDWLLGLCREATFQQRDSMILGSSYMHSVIISKFPISELKIVYPYPLHSIWNQCGLAAKVSTVFQGKNTMMFPKSLIMHWEIRGLWRTVSLFQWQGTVWCQAPCRSCSTEYKQCWGPMKCTQFYFRFPLSGSDSQEGIPGSYFSPLSSGGCLIFREILFLPHISCQCSPRTGVSCWLCVCLYLAARLKVYWS